MKLLYCHSCGDIFNLAYELKTCRCGQVKGKYDSNGSTAVVNGEGTSLAMGSGSITKAVMNAAHVDNDWRETGIGYYANHPTHIIAWARQHTGPSNSHTRIDPNL